MLNIIIHQQKLKFRPKRSSQWLKLKRLTIPRFEENEEQLELSYTADGSLNLYSHFVKLYGSIY